MSAEGKVNALVTLTGLGKDWEFPITFIAGTTPTAGCLQYRTQAVADTEEALDLGDVTTAEIIIIKCITNDVDIDLDFSVTFDADMTVNEGTSAIITNPAGSVYIKNNDAGEVSVVCYGVIGIT